MRSWTFILVFTLGMAIAAQAYATVPANGGGFAVADDDGQEALWETSFTGLAPKAFRFMIPWDAVADPTGLTIQRAKDMANAARARGVDQVVVSFRANHPKTEPAPLSNTYGWAVLQAIQQLAAHVDVWGPVNEPNCGGGWKALNGDAGAQTTAAYYTTLVGLLKTYDPTAAIIGPDLCDSPTGGSMASWINAYKSAGGGFGAAIAMHPYYDVSNNVTTQMDAMLLAIGGSTQVWVTEVGAFVGRDQVPLQTLAEQKQDVDWMVSTLATHKRVTRIHYYNLQANSQFDVALAENKSGPNKGIRRPAWYSWCTASHGGNAAHPDCRTRLNDHVASWGEDRTDYFGLAGDGSLRHKDWQAGIGWTSSWTGLGGALTSEPSAISLRYRYVNVFGRGTDNQLHQRAFGPGGWGGWVALGGSLAGRPALVARTSSNMDVFVRATDGTLQHKPWDGGGGWGPWEAMGGGLLSDPTAYSLHSGNVGAMVRGTDNQLHQRDWTAASGWSGWIALGGSIASKPAIIVRNGGASIEVFARGTDGTLQHRGWTSAGGWGPWDSMGGAMLGDPTAVSMDDGSINVFVRGTDNQVHQRSWNPSSGWSGWIALGGTISGSPTVISLREGHLNVFAPTPSGVPHLRAWTSTNGWSTWIPV